MVAVVLTLLTTLDAVDQHSGSFPTLERLVTLDPENVVNTPQLAQIRAQVASTGHLPAQGVVIEIDIPQRKMHLAVSNEELARRRAAMEARGADRGIHSHPHA